MATTGPPERRCWRSPRSVPGATNTVIGMATAYVDSTAVALFTGSTHTYMRGHGVLQELERRHHADNPRIFEPVVKEWWQPSRVDELRLRPPPRLERDDERAPGPGPDGRADGHPGRGSRGRRSRARCARGARPAASRRDRGRAGGGPAGRRQATRDRGRRRGDRRGGDGRIARAGRAAGRTGRHHLERQGGDRRDASAGRPDDRRHRLDDRQRAGLVGGRDPERRLPVRGLVAPPPGARE